MADKAQAILKINSNAQFTITDGVIEWLDGTTPISDADIQAKINAKVSGNQKLLDLGLTQAEATALTGYTPPVAE